MRIIKIGRVGLRKGRLKKCGKKCFLLLFTQNTERVKRAANRRLAARKKQKSRLRRNETRDFKLIHKLTINNWNSLIYQANSGYFA